MSLFRKVSLALAATALVIGLAACSSDDDSGSGSDDTTSTTAADSTSTSAATDSSTDDTTDDTADDTMDDSASSDGENPGVETLVDGPAAQDKTVTWTGTSFEPSEIEVAPGEVFTFVAGPDAGTAAVSFNGNDSYTITTGLTESFTLETPGTYTVTEFISQTPMTVTVTE